MLSINLKHSKTDQERKDIKIIIGKTGDDLCHSEKKFIYINALMGCI